MDKKQAIECVKETFESYFDESKFINFIKNLLKNIEEKYEKPTQGAYIPAAFAEHISYKKRIGKYIDDLGNEIDILIVYLKNKKTLERARGIQRNFIRDYLNGRMGGKLKDAALVAFVSPSLDEWRFSLVRMDYRFDENGKIREETTPARRWSFLVGKNEKSHTAQSRFVPILESDKKPTLKELEEAFSIEIISNEFFRKYRDLFVKLKIEIDKIIAKNQCVYEEFKRKNISSVDFAKKLLGQILFLYFLQKKGWFGVKRGEPWGSGSKNFLRELFEKKHSDYKNFFNDILEPLFYEALRTDRSDVDHYYSHFDCKIPFLNGGLFDPLNDYDWVNIDIILPNEIFSNNNKTKEGDIGDGILDVFDRYNFTVKEDEHLEKEVAIDPELLGKTYERLNAIREDNFDEYLISLNNKENESKFNREYGVYYTPSEIVHFMCKQSLIEYLVNEFKGKIPRTDIEKLVLYGENVLENDIRVEKKGYETKTYYYNLPESIRKNAKEIEQKLSIITVCDPAVGSGAFLVGMMNEIVKLRVILSYFTYINENTDELHYIFKRQCIENTLYGVDIDSGAVEISKLRCWLSLIVDEEDIHNIKPLPNLDYKIVKGDSLLKIEQDMNNYQTINKIENLKHLYFSETNPTQKHKYKEMIDKFIEQITDGYEIFDFNIFFSEVFHFKGGFDIVIANPPYIQLQKDRGRLAHYYSNIKFETFNRKGDIYCLFYEKGINILRKGGILCYITSNKWLRAEYAKKLRKLFTEHNPIILVDLGEGIFENATVDTCVMLLKKSINENRLIGLNIGKEEISDIFKIIDQKSVSMGHLSTDPWFIGDKTEQRLKERVEKIGRPLGLWNIKIYFGIKTGFNEAFIIDEAKRNAILNSCITDDERKRTDAIIKPVLRGRDIKRYGYEWESIYIILSRYGLYKEIPTFYPSIYKYLIRYEDKLKKRGQCRYSRSNENSNNDFSGQHHWLELDNNPKEDFLLEFEKEKIIYSEIVRSPQFHYDTEKFYIEATGFIMTGESLKYICGLLNSKPVTYLFKKFYAGGGLGNEGYRYKKAYLEKLPLPPVSKENLDKVIKIESIVDKITSIKKKNANADTNYLEKQIDNIVYELYQFVNEEIKLVESELNF